ncbi:MAG: ribosome small subunit-dependent GTPase A [Elusimicrobiales bacterium]|nr:ribosome small subunit-dependent GTPase A [Elusimicrobiales bacterium]
MSTDDNKIKLEDLGYSDFFRNKKESDSNDSLIPARIIAEHKGEYILKNEVSEFSAKITGKMMFTASSREEYPAVGDWVLINIINKSQAVIYEILPRRATLKRKAVGSSDAQTIASNIDIAFIVESTDRDYSLNRLERYFALAKSGGIQPAIVLNKTDLITEAELETITKELKERFKDTNIYISSVLTGKGISDLKKDIKKGKTYCFIGSSGVGKSSIINVLLGKNLIKTGKISSHANRGKHITTHRQLFLMETGGLLIDTPGMREIGLLDSDEGIKDVYLDIYELIKGCKFSNCTHMHEPGCAVLAAVKSGVLDKARYQNFLKLVKENKHNTMTKLKKREKDYKFGKYVKQAMKNKIKKYK